jgi:hypothetical protein
MKQVLELVGESLDYWSARADGWELSHRAILGGEVYRRGEVRTALVRLAYSTDWILAGPIIERERMKIEPVTAERWLAEMPSGVRATGETPIVAAMRAFIVNRYGPHVPADSRLHGSKQGA